MRKGGGEGGVQCPCLSMHLPYMQGVLSRKKKVFRYNNFQKRLQLPHVSNHHGLAVGDWWRLAVGGWWRLTVGGGC